MNSVVIKGGYVSISLLWELMGQVAILLSQAVIVRFCRRNSNLSVLAITKE